jgi:hypothetical protein
MERVRWVVLLMVLAGLAALVPASALAKTQPPPLAVAEQVYWDFLDNGRIDHSYPRAILVQILNDTRLNEYGDPLQMILLRRAIRLVLSGKAQHVGRSNWYDPRARQGVTSRYSTPSHDSKPSTNSRSAAKIRVEGAPAPFTNTQVALLGVPFALAVGGLLFARTRTRRSKE